MGTRGTVNHMPGMDKSGNIHWIYWWAFATFIPVGITFFLSWYFGAPGGYQPYSLIKLFLLFLQTGFVTAYFIRRHLLKAIVSLWLTITFLFGLSLIVPYLSIQANVTLDMADLSGEFSTPLYLFISCLTAAWLLPHRWRMIARIICMVFILLYVLIQFSYIGYYMTTKALLSVNMMIAMAQTNISEAISYMEVNLPYAGLAGGIIALILLGALVFLISRYSFHQEEIVSKKAWFVLLFFFFANCGLSVLSISSTRIAHVYAEAYQTLRSFGEYQSILKARRNMHITDPDVLAKLKAAPDGVYILVIGESLTRDHMHVYGYKRETTPFQTEANIDPHYTFFNHVYSQTVQVLTCALTEKNQYNGMNLSDAYSIIDLAREAGFKTTWISNQSRFGIWDTPIGAIGSECDDQYWLNQYIGTDVITKDYDTALIPYLKKVDPANRRQLIVIHLMGSHISYWDRYPGEFYHWPVDTSKERETAEVMNDEYDNSVLFNDYVMESIMNEATNYLHADAVMYFSDHGESVDKSHNPDTFDFVMTHIPFWMYLSPQYRAAYPQTVSALDSHEHQYFTNDLLYDTLVGLMHAPNSRYDKTRDFSNSAYRFNLHNLTTLLGEQPLTNDPVNAGQ